MDAYTTIVTRRSVRAYADTPVDEATREKLLAAAMQAPSAVNKQPWEFVVMDDPALLRKVPEIHPHARMAVNAPLVVLVCGDERRVHAPGYLPQDCAAATENLLLAAHALGLGGVWCGVQSQPEREQGFRDLLGIPDHVVPFALVCVGYPAETPTQPERYEPERVHRNGW